MSKLKIPFGLRDGQLLAATSVPNGLACECLCPGCGARLVAKHPKAKVAHFAHHNAESCSSGYETALHLAAKQVLTRRRELLVPMITAGRWIHDERTGFEGKSLKEIPETIVTLDRVEEESRDFEGIVPDIVAQTKGKLLFVEIAVTHFVEAEKLDRLRNIGIPTLEIDLSDSPELPTLDEIEEMVIQRPLNRRWIINPRQQHLQQAADVEARKSLEDQVIARFGSKLIMDSGHADYMRLPDAEKLKLELNGMRLTYEDLRQYLGHRVRGAGSFGVKPSVWQAAILRKFIFHDGGFGFDVDEVCQWLGKHLTITPPFPRAEKVAVWDYLVKLEEARLLQRAGGGQFMITDNLL